MQHAIDNNVKQCKGAYCNEEGGTDEHGDPNMSYCVNGYLSKLNGFTYHGDWVAWIDFGMFVNSDERFIYDKGNNPEIDVAHPKQKEHELIKIFYRDYKTSGKIRLDALGALNNLGWTFEQFRDLLKELDI